jgi:hypothetical protein
MALYRLTLEDANGKLAKVELQVPNVLAVFQCQEDSSELIKIERINRVSREPMTGIYDA